MDGHLEMDVGHCILNFGYHVNCWSLCMWISPGTVSFASLQLKGMQVTVAARSPECQSSEQGRQQIIITKHV